MKQDLNNSQHFTADSGNVFRRIADSLVVGEDLWLGYTYYINLELLPSPKLEVISDYEEIPLEEAFPEEEI